jgi:hypothetical protein
VSISTFFACSVLSSFSSSLCTSAYECLPVIWLRCTALCDCMCEQRENGERLCVCGSFVDVYECLLACIVVVVHACIVLWCTALCGLTTCASNVHVLACIVDAVRSSMRLHIGPTRMVNGFVSVAHR